MEEQQQNNVEEKNSICELLKQGMFKRDAAVMAGIDESTFYRWIESDASFASQVKASVLSYKQNLMKIVNTYAITDGRFALEILKKRWPRDWSRTEDDEESASDTKRLADTLQAIFDREPLDKPVSEGEQVLSKKEEALPLTL